jgi:hypothetical protein
LTIFLPFMVNGVVYTMPLASNPIIFKPNFETTTQKRTIKQKKLSKEEINTIVKQLRRQRVFDNQKIHKSALRGFNR